MKIVFLSIAFFVVSLSAFTQNKVDLLQDKTIKRTNVSLQGVSVGAFGAFNSTRRPFIEYSIPTAYFYEFSFYKRFTLLSNGILKYRGSESARHLLLGLEVSPRYYFYLSDRLSTLNEGWFVEMPLGIQTPLMMFARVNNSTGYQSNKMERVNIQLFKHYEYLGALGVGYRYALSNKLFIEGTLYYTYNTYNFSQGYSSFWWCAKEGVEVGIGDWWKTSIFPAGVFLSDRVRIIDDTLR